MTAAGSLMTTKILDPNLRLRLSIRAGRWRSFKKRTFTDTWAVTNKKNPKLAPLKTQRCVKGKRGFVLFGFFGVASKV